MAQMSRGPDPAIAPRLLSSPPSNCARWTAQPLPPGLGAVSESGSAGCDGVGVGQVSCGLMTVAIARDPVTARSLASGLTFLVSQASFRQGRPRACSMLLSVE